MFFATFQKIYLHPSAVINKLHYFLLVSAVFWDSQRDDGCPLGNVLLLGGCRDHGGGGGGGLLLMTICSGSNLLMKTDVRKV